MYQKVLNVGCIPFCSGDWAWVGSCRSKPRSNSAISGWREKGKYTIGGVRDRPKKIVYLLQHGECGGMTFVHIPGQEYMACRL